MLDRRQRGSIRPVLLVIIGWLVGNAVFSETAPRISLIFCMKLGDYKGRKATEPDFWKNSWFENIPEKVSKLAESQTLWYFSQNGSNDFFAFWPEVSTKYGLQFEWNHFSEKLAILRYLASKSSKNCPNWGFWPFSRLFIISFSWFCYFLSICIFLR